MYLTTTKTSGEKCSFFFSFCMFYPLHHQLLKKILSLALCSPYRDERTYYPKFGADVNPDDTVQYLEGM